MNEGRGRGDTEGRASQGIKGILHISFIIILGLNNNYTWLKLPVFHRNYKNLFCGSLILSVYGETKRIVITNGKGKQ